MNGSIVTADELMRRLASQDHIARTPPDGRTGGLDPRATPDTIVTVAVDADPTLKEAYRDRYFIWVRDQDDSLVTDRAPVFALPSRLPA